MARIRPAVRVRGCSASSASPVFPPWPSTSASIGVGSLEMPRVRIDPETCEFLKVLAALPQQI
jgi:hypothetical protein